MIPSVFPEHATVLYVFDMTVDYEQEIDVTGDPDKECDDWEYTNPCDVQEELHVPIETNAVLKYWMDN